MFRFLHAADIHLDSAMVGLDLPEDTPLDQVRGATRRAFDNLVDLEIDAGKISELDMEFSSFLSRLPAEIRAYGRQQ